MNQQEKLASLSVWAVGAIVFVVLTLATVAIFSSQSRNANGLSGSPHVEEDMPLGEEGDATIAQLPVCQTNDQCLAKEFIPNEINFGETTVLSITIVPTATPVSGNGPWIDFTDILTPGLVLASTPGDPDYPFCNSTASIEGVAGSSVFTVTNVRSMPGVPACTITVTVQATASGTYVNSDDNITGTTNLDTSTAYAQLQVNQAPQFINLPPPANATYGSLYDYTFQAVGYPPAMTYGISGTLPPSLYFDPATGQLSGTATAVGLYANIVATATNGIDPDATTTFSITVGPAPLTITADDKQMWRGSNPPPLTASYSGFTYGGTPADLDTPVALTTTADNYSPLGQYPIVGNGASDTNYTIYYVDGVMTVYANRFIEKKGMPVYPAFDFRR